MKYNGVTGNILTPNIGSPRGDCASPVWFIFYLHKAILAAKVNLETSRNILLDIKHDRTYVNKDSFKSDIEKDHSYSKSITSKGNCGPAPLLPTKAYTTLVPKFKKIPPFRGFWTKKTPLFQPKSLILTLNKTPLFKQNAICSQCKIEYPFCENENICKYIKLKTFFYVRRIFHYF